MIQFFILLFLFSTLSATDMSIDMQIQSIKNAPPSQRVELMNAFKQRVFQMNSQERSFAIQTLQQKVSTQARIKMQIPKQSITTMVNEHTAQLQIQENKDISSYQNMNQQQITNQVYREKEEHANGKIAPIKLIEQIKEKQEIQKIKLEKIEPEKIANFLQNTKEKLGQNTIEKPLEIQKIEVKPQVTEPVIEIIDSNINELRSR